MNSSQETGRLDAIELSGGKNHGLGSQAIHDHRGGIREILRHFLSSWLAHICAAICLAFFAGFEISEYRIVKTGHPAAKNSSQADLAETSISPGPIEPPEPDLHKDRRSPASAQNQGASLPSAPQPVFVISNTVVIVTQPSSTVSPNTPQPVTEPALDGKAFQALPPNQSDRPEQPEVLNRKEGTPTLSNKGEQPIHNTQDLTSKVPRTLSWRIPFNSCLPIKALDRYFDVKAGDVLIRRAGQTWGERVSGCFTLNTTSHGKILVEVSKPDNSEHVVTISATLDQDKSWLPIEIASAESQMRL